MFITPNNDGRKKNLIAVSQVLYTFYVIDVTIIISHIMVKNTGMIMNNVQVRILRVQLTVHSLRVQDSAEATRVPCRLVHHAQLQEILLLAENKLHTLYVYS